MADNIKEIAVPDIGGAEKVDVIEVLVAPGDKVDLNDSLITLEGDKATMEVPATVVGIVKNVNIKVGDKVSEGDLILSVEVAANEDHPSDSKKDSQDNEPHSAEQPSPSKAVSEQSSTKKAAAKSESTEIKVPDIGGATDVDLIEVNIKVGDEVAVDDALITLEGDKATMEVPATVAGKVTNVIVKVGDKLSQGDVICSMATTGASDDAELSAQEEEVPATAEVASTPAAIQSSATNNKEVYASPAVRRIAHEFDVDLAKVAATGPKGRVTKDDIKKHIAGSTQPAAGFALPAAPKIDFARFGKIEQQDLTKIQKFSGANLHRNWVSIPHITQFGEADITRLEAFRGEQKAAAQAQGIKLTPIVFIMKAAVAALKKFPRFNSSLDASGEHIILKKYFHIGVAVDTPNGLVVPVIKDVDQKSIFELAKELAEVSHKAREKGLTMTQMQGGCFSISSLGGIGGTAFTPIINAPEVAILGVSRTEKRPVYVEEGALAPHLMLPLSLSYDHRVIDGADGARFMVYLASCLSDIRMILL